MFSVTSSAKEQLKINLQKEKKDEGTLIRLAPSPSNPEQLGFFLDTEKKGDRIIEDNKGERLLLIGKDIAPTLTKVVLDYAITAQGMGFTLERKV
ncbi:MAG: hypothetical protein SV375_00795 [Thermodesulfobacteriota bacterium]|nr:hypothetical protein [Thermodesulfobacteriota bacterium]